MRQAGATSLPKILGSRGWRVVEDVADGDDVHLPSQAFVRGVDADGPAVAAGAGVNIDAIIGVHLGGVLQLGQRHEEPAGAVKEDDVLVAFDRVGVEEEPLAAGQDGRIEIDAAHVRHAVRLARAVVFVDREVASFEDRVVVQPGVMAGGHVEEPHVLAVGRDRPAAGVRRLGRHSSERR